MTETTEMTAPTHEPAPQTLVALTPGDVAPAQAQLEGWCTQKMRALGQEYRELQANIRIAKKNRWSRGGLLSAASRTKGEIQYFHQIRAAVRAGYLIVPNFDVEIMAVKVSGGRPASRVYTTDSAWSKPLFEVTAEQLPLGTGTYVGQRLARDRTVRMSKDAQGNAKKDYDWKSTGYQLPSFPGILVKPIILEATERAMSLKIFDRIGVVTGRKKDPVVVGQILHPKKYRDPINFFIAWWLDTRDLE